MPAQWFNRMNALVCLPLVSFIFLLFSFLKPVTWQGEVAPSQVAASNLRGEPSRDPYTTLPPNWKGCSGNESLLLARQVAEAKPYPVRFAEFSFSDALTETVDACVSDIGARVALGRFRALEMKVLVGGLIRDGGSGVPNSFKAISDLVKPFVDHRVVLFESDSQDNTEIQLYDWQQQDPLRRTTSSFTHNITWRAQDDSTLFYWNTENYSSWRRTGLERGRLARMAHVRNLLRMKMMSVTVWCNETYGLEDRIKFIIEDVEYIAKIIARRKPQTDDDANTQIEYFHADDDVSSKEWVRLDEDNQLLSSSFLDRVYANTSVAYEKFPLADQVCPNFQPDIIILLDLDVGLSCIEPVDTDMVHAVLGRPEFVDGSTDMVCAQGLKRQQGRGALGYFDTMPLRYPEHEAISGIARPANYDPIEHDYPELPKQVMQGSQLRLVHSCFGGLALYRPNALRVCDYDENGFDSEHVSLHKCMRDKGMTGIYIDPLMVVRGDSAHGSNPLTACQMCPPKERVLETPMAQRWDQWDWGANAGLGCDLPGCGGDSAADDMVPCVVKSQPATRCTCVNLVDGGETDEGCECLPEVDE